MTALPEPPLIDAQHMALFLDVDGTLIPFADHPQQVSVPEGLTTLLHDLKRKLDGALALVSGRSIEELQRLFPDGTFDLAGLHGLQVQKWGAPEVEMAQGQSDIRDMLEPLEAFASKHEGVLIEDKGPAIALHYRMAPEVEEDARALVLDLAANAENPVGVLDGKCVLEVKPALANKGVAIDHLLAGRPYEGRRPVFLGDDVTDEFGFAAANRRDGISVKVGPQLATTKARYALESPGHVYDWLTKNAHIAGER